MPAGSLFSQCDLHVHTHFSACAAGEMRLPAILEACAQRGIRYLGITDHIFAGTDPAILDLTRQEVAKLDAPLQVFVGCEADILGVGRHAVTDAMRETLDFVAVSANHFHVPTVAGPETEDPETVARHFLAMFEYACSLPFVDTIVHPMYVMPGTYDPGCLELLTEADFQRAMDLARENCVAVEISPRALGAAQQPFLLRFYRRCKEAGLKFSFGSDSHRLVNVGRTDALARLVEALDIHDEDVWLPGGAS